MSHNFHPSSSSRLGQGQDQKTRPMQLDFTPGSRKKTVEDDSNDANLFLNSPIVDIMNRSHSTGQLKFPDADAVYEFATEDLIDHGEIGQGAFGQVNRMEHKYTGRLMAVKRIRSTMDRSEEKRLLMDLEVIVRSHDCKYIVQFYGAVFKEGDCWICMELMDTSLEKLYKCVRENMGEYMPEPIIAKIAIATLKALTYLKDMLKIMHRDVKPSNILLNRRGDIKLCDFGIAGQLVDSIAKTRDAGCRPYMAPERIDPTRSGAGYNVRSDVWSLGITLVEIVTGKFPYPSWNSVFDQLQEVVNGDPPILTQTPDNRFSNDLMVFVNSCLIKDDRLRPKYQELMQFNFYRRYENEQVDVASYVIRVLQHYQPSVNLQNGPAIGSQSRMEH